MSCYNAIDNFQYSAGSPGRSNGGSSTNNSGGGGTASTTPTSTHPPLQRSNSTVSTSSSSSSKMEHLRTWSISTYKCTKQLLAEKLGKTSRTVDTGELERDYHLRGFTLVLFSWSVVSLPTQNHVFICLIVYHNLELQFSDP